jgi:microcin C transport system substrate-binding protein
MRLLFVALSLFIFSLNLWPPRATAAITGGDPAAKIGGELVYEAYEPNTLNPMTFNQVGSYEVLQRWIFDRLVDWDNGSGEDIPWLAKKWTISPDGKVFTFILDERAKWFDGKPVTAEDVKFSFDCFNLPGVKAPFRKASVSAFEKIEVVDAKSIKFTAKEKLFSNFEFLTNTLILPQHLYSYDDPDKMESNEYTKAPKGSGPYMVQEWKKGESTTLIRNPNYWGKVLPQNKGAFNFDRIVIRYIRDPQMAFEKVKKGDLDYMPIRIGNTELWDQTKTDKAFTSGKVRALTVSSKIQEGYGFVGFNLRQELFKEQKLRKALARAINREELIKKSLSDLAEIAKGPLYSNNNFSGKFVPVKYDPALATKELGELGWKDTDGDYVLDKGGRKLSFTVLVPNARIEKEMLFIQDYWKKIGIQANVKILEYSTWKQLQDERKFEALSNGKSRTFLAKNVDAYNEWHSANVGNALGNYTGYSNPKVDELIIKGRQEMDAKKRKKIFDQVNDIVAEDYAIIQYSESKYQLHAVNSSIILPKYQGKEWFPYDLGLKYWYKK